MSRYDRYSDQSLGVLMTTQELALRQGRADTNEADLAYALVLSALPEVLEQAELRRRPINDFRMRELDSQFLMPAPEPPSHNLKLSDGFRSILNRAENLAGPHPVEPKHIMEAAWPDVRDYILQFFGDEAAEGPGAQTQADGAASAMPDGVPEPDFDSPMGRYCDELTDRDWPFFGREKELDALVASMLKYWKPNPLILGESGVGKTALVHGLVNRIRSGRVPKALEGARIFEVRLSDILAGTSLHGALEENLNALIEAAASTPNAFLFIDEMHQVVPSFANNPISEVLKPALSRPGLRIIGATTLSDYARYLEKDSAFMRRFQPVLIKEPGDDEVMAILRGVAPLLAGHFSVSIAPQLLGRVLDLTKRYLPQRRFPDKAMDALDRACAQAAFSAAEALEERHIVDAVRLLGSMSDEASVDPSGALLGLEKTIARRIKGQDEALAAVCQAVRVAKLRLDLHPGRPDGAFLFTGPTGVGKTAMAESLALALTGREDALFRIDMSEFSDAHTAARLLGAPPGYIGFDEQPLLTRAVATCSGGVLLLDELEKAHPQVHRVFLQILDSGRATDSSGRVLSFSSITVIATCNVGSESGPVAGFMRGDGASSRVPMPALKRIFPPELLNRFDAIVPFRALDRDDALKIVRETVAASVNDRLEREYGLRLAFSDEALSFLAREGFSEEFGARNLHRAWRRLVSTPLASLVSGRQRKPSWQEPKREPELWDAEPSGTVKTELWTVEVGQDGLIFTATKT